MAQLDMNKENTDGFLIFANDMFEKLLENNYLSDDVLSSYEYINRKRVGVNKFYDAFRNIRDTYLEMVFAPKEKKVNDLAKLENIRISIQVSKMSLEEKFAVLLAA